MREADLVAEMEGRCKQTEALLATRETLLTEKEGEVLQRLSVREAEMEKHIGQREAQIKILESVSCCLLIFACTALWHFHDAYADLRPCAPVNATSQLNIQQCEMRERTLLEREKVCASKESEIT